MVKMTIRNTHAGRHVWRQQFDQVGKSLQSTRQNMQLKHLCNSSSLDQISVEWL